MRIWASWNKKIRCVHIKSKNSEHTSIWYKTNRYCSANQIHSSEVFRYLQIDHDWKSKLILKIAKDVMKLIIKHGGLENM